LGVLYESFIHPVTILSTLPSAGIGALLALMIAGDDLTIVAIIGIILLIGIVKKNAIMMIDFALEAERHEGKSPREAIYQACLLRFRPILMTTMAAVLGALPLMLGTGAGSELRHPLGISIVGGLLLSQLLTLFTTPVSISGSTAWRSASPAARTKLPSRRNEGSSWALQHHSFGGRSERRCSPSALPRRAWWLSSSCRSRRCPRSISQPFPFAPPCRAAAHRTWQRRSQVRLSATSVRSPMSPR